VNAQTADFDEEEVSLLTLGTGARETVRTGGDAVGVTDARELLFVRDRSLMSAPYDPTRHLLSSEAREMVAGVRGGSGAAVALSTSGTLAYMPSADLKRRSIVWISPDGTQTDANFGRRPFWAVSLSPDGRRVAVAADDHDGTALYVGDASGGALTPVATNQSTAPEMPRSPDGKSFAGGDRTGRLLRFSVLGAGAREPLLADSAQSTAEQWTPDVQGYPSPAGRIQVSTEGGTRVRWAKNSNRLYFINGTTLMVSTVTTYPDLRSDVPRPVVTEPLLAQDNARRQYDVALDGRILAIKDDDSVRFDYIVVVQNWLSEARALLSAPQK
jgi:hypothetical protein